MKKMRFQILLLALCILAMSAGVVAGLVASRAPRADAQVPTARPIERTPLVEELQLTPDQQRAMRLIWEDVRLQVHETFDDAERLHKERENALIELLSDDQKAMFEKIAKGYAGRFDELTRKRDQAFEAAVAQTKKLLNDEQRTKYEDILKTQVKHRTERSPG